MPTYCRSCVCRLTGITSVSTPLKYWKRYDSGPIDEDLGHDVSLSLIYRPFMSQNIVVRLSAASLIAEDGFDDLYGNEADSPYSILANITLMY